MQDAAQDAAVDSPAAAGHLVCVRLPYFNRQAQRFVRHVAPHFPPSRARPRPTTPGLSDATDLNPHLRTCVSLTTE